ncbi:hypothetical protein AB0F15_23565 [Amycolatopsis sp. NPDC026612]|uniref:hypothetical protein n=1 Tax=Amycolatopsis sp. NPDC026612 TaxID=3155466 RepID=UPI0033D51C9F
MDDVLLFWQGDLDDALRQTAKAMAKHLQDWDADDLLLIDQARMPEPAEIQENFEQFGRRYTRG